MGALQITPLRAFSDNYIWVLYRDREAVVVDPGDAAPVKQFLQQHALHLSAIIITHWHPDHTGGLAELADDDIPVYGPAAEKITGLTTRLKENDRIRVQNLEFRVLEVPGHTAGHIAYYCDAEDILLCGDTLFSAGCGRLFEGTPGQMYSSLRKLAVLPAATRVFCTHEYTLSNLQFAAAAEPGNPQVHSYTQKVRALRDKDEVSLPSTIGLELSVNPFLRTDSPEIRKQAEERAGHSIDSEAEVLGVIRQWKDVF